MLTGPRKGCKRLRNAIKRMRKSKYGKQRNAMEDYERLRRAGESRESWPGDIVMLRKTLVVLTMDDGEG